MVNGAAYRVLGLTVLAILLAGQVAALTTDRRSAIVAGLLAPLVIPRIIALFARLWRLSLDRPWRTARGKGCGANGAVSISSCLASRAARLPLLLVHLVPLLSAAALEVMCRSPAVPASLSARMRAGAGDRSRLWVGRIVGVPSPGVDGTLTRIALVATGPDQGASPVLEPVAGRVLAAIPGHRPEPGEWWLFRGRLALEPGRRNPGGIDRARRAAREGIAGRLRISRPGAARPLAERPSAFSRPDLAIASGMSRLRAGAHGALAASMGLEAAGLADAMALGSRGTLDPEIGETFRVLGWSHLIAVSGLHVGFVAGLAAALLRLVRRRPTGLPLAGVLVFYAALTGARPPVVRATSMALLAIAARGLNRPLPAGRGLTLAALLGLALAPQWLSDPGFQLSFAAVTGIALLGPRIDLSHPLLFLLRRGLVSRFVTLPLWVGFAAQLGCLPVQATTFHAATGWGIVSAPIAVPLACGFVSSVVIGLLVSVLPGPPGEGCLAGAAVIGEVLLAMGRAGAGHLPAPLPVGPPGPVLIACFVAGALGAAKLRGCPTARAGAAFLAAIAAVLMVSGLPPGPGSPVSVEVVFLDVGQGDAAIVLAHGDPGWPGRCGLTRRPQLAVVIDTGDHPPEGLDAGARIVAKALASAHARAVDALILSHGDRDHTGGLRGLSSALPLGVILWPRALAPPAAVVERTGDGGSAGPRVPLGSAARIPLRLAASRDTLIDRPGIRLIALHPPAGFDGNENDGSLVVRLEAFGQRVLFAGDIEGEGESILCREQADELQCAVVKVPHHGSSTSSSTAFVAATEAAHAVVSVGARNRFGHPDPRVIEHWSRAGTRVWRTDQWGAVVVVLDSTGVRVRGMASGR